MRKLCVFFGLVAVSLFAAQSSAFAGFNDAKRLVVVMTASDEVPLCEPATNAARGSAVFKITDAAAGTVNYKLVANNLPGDITMAHIHQAPAGTPGPIVQPLELTPGAENGVIGRGTFTNPTVVAGLQSNPSGFYVNVHSSVCMPGVIRGQFGDRGSAK
jgi:hypothetical protein